MSNLEERLDGIETRMAALEKAIAALSDSLAGSPAAQETSPDQAVVTLLARQLQRLVPETCEHPPEMAPEERTLEGTDVKCTEEVQGRLKRIPIPFVRELVIKKVADYAREHHVDRVDIQTFEKAATF